MAQIKYTGVPGVPEWVRNYVVVKYSPIFIIYIYKTYLFTPFLFSFLIYYYHEPK